MKKSYLWLIILIIAIVAILISLKIANDNAIKEGDNWQNVNIKSNLPTINSKKEIYAEVVVYNETENIIYVISCGTTVSNDISIRVSVGHRTQGTNTEIDKQYRYIQSSRRNDTSYNVWRTYGNRKETSLSDLPVKNMSGTVIRVEGPTSIITRLLSGLK